MGTTAAAGLAPYALALLRIVAGVTFLVHGYSKVGVLGGFAGWVGSLGVPAPQIVTIIVTVVEVAGGAALIMGLTTAWASLALAAEMVVTTLLVKLPTVGFMAPADRPGVGAELDLLLLAACLVIWTAGAGALSLEAALRRR
jgi:putative oxidoreductase